MRNSPKNKIIILLVDEEKKVELAQYISLMKKTLRMPSAFFLELTAKHVHPTQTRHRKSGYRFIFPYSLLKESEWVIVSREKLFGDMWYWNGNTHTHQFDENAKKLKQNSTPKL